MDLFAALKNCVKAFIRGVSNVVAFFLMEHPAFAGKFFPYQSSRQNFLLLKETQAGFSGPATLPIPPKELWEGYGPTEDEYLSSGQKNVQAMRQIFQAAGLVLQKGDRILEFGCAAGRMLRWLSDLATDCECWGADISAHHISWCQQHLSPPFLFVTTTTLPHLPFEDGFFKFIFAGSVFTHISDLADTWLLELRRTLCPGGMLYLTVHDNHTLELIKKSYPKHWLTRLVAAFDRRYDLTNSNFGMFTIARSPKGAQVFYDRAFLTGKLGRYFKVISVNPEAYGYQTAVLLGKDR